MMEIKTINTCISANSIIFEKNIEQPIDAEITLPDYCPQINKILKCAAQTRVVSKGINGQIISVDGNIVITVFYCDENGDVFSYEYLLPFSKSVDAGIQIDGATIICKTNTEYLNCKVMTKRKIEIHGAAGIIIKAKSKHSCEILCDISGADIKTNCSQTIATVPLGDVEKNLIIEEELDVGQLPLIKSIVRYDASAIISDTKIIGNKAVIKGDFKLSVLYCPKDTNRLQTFEQVLPFSQIIEVENLTEQSIITGYVDVANLEIKPRIESDGYFKSFIICAKLCIRVSAVCDSEISVIYDAYSTKYDTELTQNNVKLEKLVKTINENYICTKKLEFSDGAIENIIDIWCENSRNTTVLENDALIISGTVLICILARDSSDAAVYHERPVDYEYKFPFEIGSNNIKCEPQIHSNISGFTLSGANSIDLSINLNIFAQIFSISNINVISEIKINDSEPKGRSADIALYIYYAQRGETLWDIARRYNSSKEEIFKINEISDDVLSQDMVLIIPVC